MHFIHANYENVTPPLKYESTYVSKPQQHLEVKTKLAAEESYNTISMLQIILSISRSGTGGKGEALRMHGVQTQAFRSAFLVADTQKDANS